MSKGGFKQFDVRKYMVIIILLVLVAFFSLMTPNFSKPSNLFTILRQVTMVGILSVGASMVMISGGIDLSLGVQMGLSGVTAAILMVKQGWPIAPAFLAALAATTLVGLVNGLVITYTRIPPLIATLGMQNIIRGINYISTEGLPVYGLPAGVNFIGQGHVGVVPMPAIIMAVMFVIGGFILNQTYLGRYFYALGSNEEAARLSGLKTQKVRILGYTIAGFLAGIAGLVLMSRVNSAQPMSGYGNEMDVITACVVGGVSVSGGEGNIFGLIAGVLIMGVLSNGLAVMGLGEYYQLAVKGMVLILAVGFDCVQRMRANKTGVLKRAS